MEAGNTRESEESIPGWDVLIQMSVCWVGTFLDGGKRDLAMSKSLRKTRLAYQERPSRNGERENVIVNSIGVRRRTEGLSYCSLNEGSTGISSVPIRSNLN